MKLKFTFLLILFIFVFVKSQNDNLLGIITNENNHRIINVTIVNLNSNQVFIPNDRGEFLVLAKSGDLLRFVIKGYERYNYKVTENSFQNPVTIVMTKQPKEIEEVKLTYKFKGNLAKDVNYLNLSQQKMQDLKDDINLSLIIGNREAKSQKDFNQNPLPKYET